MSKKLTQSDILEIILDEHGQIINSLIENLKAYSGKGDEKKALLSKGLKVVHEESGLIYTVLDLIETDQGTVLVCIKPTGERFDIPSKKFKEYKRL